MKLLEKHFEIALETPDGITRLRELILKLAMQGKLIEQNSNDKPAQKLLEEIEKEKERLINKKLIKKQSPLSPLKNNEIPFSIPENWKWVKLNTFLDVRDGTHDTPKYVDFGFPLITSKNLYSGTLSFDDVKYISEQDHYKISERSKVDKDDILFAMIGSIGNPVLVDTDIDFSIKNVALIKYFNKEKYNVYFILNYLIYAQNIIKSQASGAVQSFVSLGFLRNYPFPLPPLEEQKKIVEKIDQLMLLCDKLESERNQKNKLQLQMNLATTNKLINAKDEVSFNNTWSFIANQFDILYTVKQNVTDLKNIIFELASRGRIVNQNINDIPVEEQIKIFDSNLYNNDKSLKIKSNKVNTNIHINEVPYEIPNNWKWMRLKDIAIYNGRPNVKPTEIFDNTWVLDLEDIEKDTSRLLNKIANLERQSKSTKSSFKNGDILYGKLRPYLNKVIVADEDGVCTTEIVPIVPSKLIISDYLVILLKRSTFLNYVNSLSYGVKMPRLGTNDAEMSIHPIPPLNEQIRIVEKVNQLFKLCDKLEKNIEQSSQKQSQILNAVLAQV